MSSWELREAKSEDAAGVEKFLLSVDEFKDSLREGEERAVWSWLYDRRQDGRISAVVAEVPGRGIVGHYGISPIEYLVNGQRVLAGMVCKLAVDKEFRKAPLSIQMSFRLLRSYKAVGLQFVQGLANRSGLLEFHLAFGFKNLGEVPILARPIKFSKAVRARFGAKLGAWLWPAAWLAENVLAIYDMVVSRLVGNSAIEIEQVRQFPEDADFEAVLARFHSVFGRRTPEALRNRFLKTAFRGYEIYLIKENDQCIGYFVLRAMPMKEFDALGIVDVCFDFDRRDVARRMSRFSISRARALGVDLLAVLTSSEHLESQLSRELFLRTPETFSLVVHEPKADILTREPAAQNWFITWYDHDFV